MYCLAFPWLFGDCRRDLLLLVVVGVPGAPMDRGRLWLWIFVYVVVVEGSGANDP